jgi:hypothetical protein
MFLTNVVDTKEVQIYANTVFQQVLRFLDSKSKTIGLIFTKFYIRASC